MSYAHPYESPVPIGGFEIVHGPEGLADTIVQQYRKRWVAWVASEGIRFAEYEDGFVFSDTAGSANTLLTNGERPTRFSWSFEQDALYAIAYEDSATTVLLTRFVSGTPTEYTWTGKSPLLFYNGILEPDTGATDLMAFYIKPAGTKIFARVQRENFATEHELNGELNVTLAYLVKTEAVNIEGAWHQMIWARTTDGRDVVYQSRAYPPPYVYASDRMSLAVSLSGGVLFAPIVNESASDSMSVAVSLASGDAFNTINRQFAPGDRISHRVDLQSGTYSLTVVTGATQTDRLSVGPELRSGTYSDVIIDSGEQTDSISLAVELKGGVYSL